MELDVQSLPAVCLNWATDVLEKGPDAQPIETTVALDGLRAATTPQFGMNVQAECKVLNCPVRCRLLNKVSLDGTVQLLGVSSEDGATDLRNCGRP